MPLRPRVVHHELFSPPPLALDRRVSQTLLVRISAPVGLAPRSLSTPKNTRAPRCRNHRSARRNKFFWVNRSEDAFLAHLRRPVAPGGASSGHMRHNRGAAFSARGEPGARRPGVSFWHPITHPFGYLPPHQLQRLSPELTHPREQLRGAASMAHRRSQANDRATAPRPRRALRPGRNPRRPLRRPLPHLGAHPA